MTTSLRISLLQMDAVLGDVFGNARRILEFRARAFAEGADLVVAPEMVLPGYPPEDLVFQTSFLEDVRRAVDILAEATTDGGPGLLVGGPWRSGSGCTNSAFLIDTGRLLAVTSKVNLPNDGVFDEKRVFVPGSMPKPLRFRQHRLGVILCEDLWSDDVVTGLVSGGADILIALNASPFEIGCGDIPAKPAQRLEVARKRVEETGLGLVYVNKVGGQDEVVFDGGSFAVSPGGKFGPSCVLNLPHWREEMASVLMTAAGGELMDVSGLPPYEELSENEHIYRALVTGLGDYVNKNGFPGVLIGLSGGIDSALAAAVAVDALGPDRVRGVLLRSPYTSAESVEDAYGVARLLGIRLDDLDIQPGIMAVNHMLEPLFAGVAPDLTEENIQARLRGLLLMALSNKFHPMLIATSNKSETSVGYSTLYGDMCGGFSVLKDVYKTRVFALSRWRNALEDMGPPGEDAFLGAPGPVMPERVISKAPSAELRENQKDEDTLPPYVVLDAILELLIEREFGIREAALEGGFDIELVRRVWTMLARAEYKRRQAPPGVKVTRLAFGRDRRYPITNAYNG
ncbi:NAD+ synthase [Phaeovibrio sulfidiphilus]|uniref:Glutamine-dependent NAD(+) synthetase n=1 Tax=Phaeovibrio sulfidiphilus TaxID=1220600 RepID=A0A8J6Z022_9PROT|nr:NAD+ synthase [Phaeovibrio sulfidiphilus]MBE1237568.1 NAD+ synthase [Phaeovibrio sulfidiphilus]